MKIAVQIAVAYYLVLSLVSSTVSAGAFAWPDGKRAAVSLTFDDGRESMLDVAIPLLNRYDIKATFYVLPQWVKPRLSEWREVAAAGHEIGNHTMCHPGSGNFPWAGSTALEDYTLNQMADELDAANVALEMIFGSPPLTYAYTCGQKSVGRGRDVKSYVPVVAERFLAGRGWLDETCNDPTFCDLAQVMGMKLDGLDFEQLKVLIDQARERGSWLVLVGHDVGAAGPQTTRVETLAAFCEYATDPANGLWVGTVADVASYIASNRVAEDAAQVAQLRRPTKRVVFYAGTMLGIGVLSFLCATLLQTRIPLAMLRLVLLSGAGILLLGSIWWIRYGYIGPRGLIPIFAIVGYLLGTWGAGIRRTPTTATHGDAAA